MFDHDINNTIIMHAQSRIKWAETRQIWLFILTLLQMIRPIQHLGMWHAVHWDVQKIDCELILPLVPGTNI